MHVVTRRQIFQPDACQLRPTDPDDLAARMAGRRLIMLGDSLMRLHFFSLGCLLRSHVASGRGVTWDRSEIKWKGDYTAKLDGREIQVQLPHQLQWCICLVISFLVGSCAIHVQAAVALSLSLFQPTVKLPW